MGEDGRRVPAKQKPACKLNDQVVLSGSVSSMSRCTYATLDAMRGIAAIAVVTLHASDLFGSFRFPAGWLSVDLFFCLSGFVITHAYGAELAEGLSASKFMRLRLVRLYPLFALSIVVSLLIALFAHLQGNGTLQAASSAFPSALFLPNPFSATLYPLNLPAWSLMMELLVNAAAAVVWRRLTNGALAVVVSFSAAALLGVTYYHGTLDGGDKWSGFDIGLTRVFFSFFAGVALYRIRLASLPKVAPVWLMLSLPLALWVAGHTGVLMHLVIVMVLFPSLILFASQNELASGGIAILAGRLSYALYVLHSDILTTARIFEHRFGIVVPSPLGGVLSLAIAVAVCWLADVLYDRPLRERLLASNPRFYAAHQPAR